MAKVQVDIVTKESGSRSVQSLGDQFKKLAGSFTVATGAAIGVGLAIKGALDVAEKGAALRNLEQTFNNLAASIDTTADALLGRLRDATRGMVADADLMGSANRFMSMGLAKTAEEAEKLATIAVTLGSAMGKGPTAAMEEFALMLANQSIPRLDTFGISAGQVRTRIEELQAATPGLSRETAFLTAVMEQATISMEKIGPVAENSASVIKAQFTNAVNDLKIAFADGLQPAMKDTAALFGDLADETTAAGQAVRELSTDLGDVVISINDLTRAYAANQSGIAGLSKFFQSTAADGSLLQDTMAFLADGLKSFNIQALKANLSIGGFAEAASGTALFVLDNARAVAKLGGDMNILVQVIDKARLAWVGFQKPAAGAVAEAESFDRALMLMRGNINSATMATTELAVSMSRVADSMAEVGDSSPKMQDASSNIRRMADEALRLGDASTKMHDTAAALEDIAVSATHAAAALGMTAESGDSFVSAMDEIINQTRAFAESANGMVGNQEALNQSLFAAVDAAGASAQELAVLAGALGLYSDEAIEAALQTALVQAKIAELAAAYVAGEIGVHGMRQALADFVAGLGETEQASLKAANAVAGTGEAALTAKIGVDELTGALGGIPTDVHTTVTADTSQAEEAISRLEQKLRGLIDDANSAGGGATGGATGGGAGGDMAAGGLVRGGIPGVDSVPTMLMPGEYVVRKNAVDKIGVDYLDNLNRGTPGQSQPGRTSAANGGSSTPVPAGITLILPNYTGDPRVMAWASISKIGEMYGNRMK